MTPNKMTLRHVCQHADKEIVFKDGLNSVNGGNGTGKSNILHALCLCLAQDTRLPGKKSDMIQDGYDKAELFLEFVHRDLPGHIKVTLKRNYPRNWEEQSLLVSQAKHEVQLQQENPSHQVDESTLKLATFTPKESTGFVLEWGETKLRNGTEIQEWTRNEVGVAPKLIVSTFFPTQGDIDGALSADKSERQAVFSAKAGTAMCEVIWNLLGKELTGLEDFTGIEDRYAQAKATKAITTAKVTELRLSFAEIENLDRDANKWNRVLHAHLQASLGRKKLGELAAEYASLDSLLAKAKQDTANNLGIGMSLRAKFDEMKPQRDLLLQNIARAESVAQREAQRTKMVGELSGAKEQLKQALSAIPQDPPSDASLTDLAGQVANYEAEARRLDGYLKVFKTGKCPTCGTVIAAPEKIKELESSLQTAREASGTLGVQKVSLEGARKQLHAAKLTWDAKVTSLRAKIAQLEATLATMPGQELLMTPADIEQAKGRLQEAQEVEGMLQKAREAHAASSGLVGRYTASLEALAKQGRELAASLEGATSDEDYAKAQAALGEAQANQALYNDIKVQLGIAEGRLVDAETTLQDTEAAMSRVGPQRAWKDRVEKARSLLHRDAMPSEVVAWYAGALVNHTMNYLKLFEIGFEVIVTPDLGLMAIFPDKAMPVYKLSGGEKNMLNISMRLAMADLFPSDLRLLILDEVEVHLDQTNVAKLPVLLEKVKCLARNRGLVVLFVSHHPSLRDIADHVIYSCDM